MVLNFHRNYEPIIILYFLRHGRENLVRDINNSLLGLLSIAFQHLFHRIKKAPNVKLVDKRLQSI